MFVSLQGFSPYNNRISLIRCSGIPIAIYKIKVDSQN